MKDNMNLEEMPERSIGEPPAGVQPRGPEAYQEIETGSLHQHPWRKAEPFPASHGIRLEGHRPEPPSPILIPEERILLPVSHLSKNLSTLTPPELRRFTPFHSLTDTKYPKRRPNDHPRRKRASLKPPGPYAWVKCVPGEPILPNQPDEGSVKRRNEKKRIKQHRQFIMSEKRKRKAQMQEARKKKLMKRVERKMAAVARERAWAERLVELKRIEEEKKKSAAA
ncbi:hypothetical protein STAS_34248 [Striga asiatica]|uniref:Uncharacterized protein n=1 Tax=Striga asiatica TaxID=4170 RepID=A0A5A7RH14_STRAF|nr:hypothetical protein STAS_34248 [Striga asiatica]